MTEHTIKDVINVYQDAEKSKESDLAKLKQAIQNLPLADWLPALSFNILVRTQANSHIPVESRFGAIVYTNDHKPMLKYGSEPMLFPANHTLENIKAFYRQQGMTHKELMLFDRYELVPIHLEINNTKP